MKRIIIILLLTVASGTVLAMTPEASPLNAQQELNKEIQEDLKRLESDIQRAEEYHSKEQAYEAMEKDKTIEAAALLDLIQKKAVETSDEQPLISSIVSEEPQQNSTEAQQNPEETLKKLELLDKTEAEILEEPALQNKVQEASEKVEDLELA